VLLSKQATAVVRDYDRQRSAGLDPVFDPEDIGITNAPVWKEIAARKLARDREVTRRDG
jgi:AGCS family alanine or glycine:cation symporter